MSDDLSKRRPQDASKISLTEKWEVEYWCKKFGCTETQLRAAVKAVGNDTVGLQVVVPLKGLQRRLGVGPKVSVCLQRSPIGAGVAERGQLGLEGLDAF